MNKKHAPNKGKPITKKTIFLISGGVLIVACMLWLLFWPHAIVIGFYAVPQKVQNAIVSLAKDPAYAGKTKFSIRILDSSKPLSSQLTPSAHIALLFTYDGMAAEKIAAKTSAPDKKMLNLMPSAMRTAGTTKTAAFGLPLLLDNFELDYNKLIIAKAGLGIPKTMESMISIAKKIKKPNVWPMVCAGAQDTDLLMFIGSLTEAFGGRKAWDATTTGMKNGKDFKSLVRDTPLGTTLQQLIKWRKEGLLHPEWFRMTDKDTLAFIENNFTGFIFMPFSTHRTITARTAEKLDSIPIPAIASLKERSYTAPMLLGILPSRKANPKAQKFLNQLIQGEGQRLLAIQTGLAPVNSTADTPDRQASDLRFWIAASNGPLPDPSQASFDSPDQRADLAKNIRLYLEAEGAGF